MRGRCLLTGAVIVLAMTASGYVPVFAAPASDAAAARGPMLENVAAPTGRDATGPVIAAAGREGMKLPPISSIRGGSDIRPFLGPGVPAEVSAAALRRAWTTDPAIRDFVGMTEDLP
jgi:uncharacterized protein DUF3306